MSLDERPESAPAAMMSSSSSSSAPPPPPPRAPFRSEAQIQMNEALEARKQAAEKIHESAKRARMFVMETNLAASVQANARIEAKRRQDALAAASAAIASSSSSTPPRSERRRRRIALELAPPSPRRRRRRRRINYDMEEEPPL